MKNQTKKVNVWQVFSALWGMLSTVIVKSEELVEDVLDTSSTIVGSVDDMANMGRDTTKNMRANHRLNAEEERMERFSDNPELENRFETILEQLAQENIDKKERRLATI